MSENSASLVKVFLEANTKQDLIRKQLANNIAHSKRFIYDTPMKDGRKWIVWYFGEVGEDFILKGIRKMNDRSS